MLSHKRVDEQIIDFLSSNELKAKAKTISESFFFRWKKNISQLSDSFNQPNLWLPFRVLKINSISFPSKQLLSLK